SGSDWLFDIDALTRTMNYEPIVAGTQETVPVKDYILLPLWTADPSYSQDPKSSQDDGSKPSSDNGKKVDEYSRKDSEGIDQEKEDNARSQVRVLSRAIGVSSRVRKGTGAIAFWAGPNLVVWARYALWARGHVATIAVKKNNVNVASINEVNDVGEKISIELPFDPNMSALEDYSIFDSSRDDEDNGVVADMNNLDTTIQVSPILTTRIHKDHPLDQVYVDDIIFGSTKKELCNSFEKLMHEKFQMSSMGELTFFKITNEDGKEVDVHMYRSMIGSLMYLTSSRPDIMFTVCTCARYQVNPKVSYLPAMKRIFSDYAGASLDRKSTTGGCQFLGCRLISW
ncbi:hypothetical protein Tco_1322294, partial [Tanacetum coccineum]